MTANLNAFLAQNAVKPENRKVEVSKRFRNADGTTATFELRAITSKEDEELRKVCTKIRQVPGKPGRVNAELDTDKYLGMLAAACTVEPDLQNAQLQDSYGTMEPDELLKKMLLPGEYVEYLRPVQEINGFDISMDELKKMAKN